MKRERPMLPSIHNEWPLRVCAVQGGAFQALLDVSVEEFYATIASAKLRPLLPLSQPIEPCECGRADEAPLRVWVTPQARHARTSDGRAITAAPATQFPAQGPFRLGRFAVW